MEQETAGVVELQRGSAELALRDLTGYFGRCDAYVQRSELHHRRS